MSGPLDHTPSGGGDSPSLPPGWAGAAERLYRLSSGDGGAVAWVCPELGANVVAYAVTLPDGWGQILHQDGPAALRERPSRFGLPILFPFPGHMVGGRYRWRGQEYSLPMLNPAAPSYTHGFGHQRPWRVTQRDESALTAVLDTRTDLEPAQRAGYPFDVVVTLQLTLGAGGLGVALAAENVGPDDAPVAIGLHPYFDPAFFRGADRTALEVFLPGRRLRHLTAGPPVPTGTSEAAQPSAAIRPVPPGQAMLVSRTGLASTPSERPTARIVGPGTSDQLRVAEVVMDVGWEDVLLFAPADGPSISIEPHTGAPGAASLPPDDPDGLRGLAPGATLETRVQIRVVPPAPLV